jgi:hypothetical protein
MWNLRSTAHHLVPAFICLISSLIANGAHAQPVTNAGDGKHVEVLQIREASTTNEGSDKKAKTVTPAKKKIVKRKTHGQTKVAANEGVPNPNTSVGSAMAVVAPGMPAQNDNLTPSAEQTGILAVGDRALALASSEDNNVGLSVGNYVGTKEDPSARALVNGNPPPSIAGAEQALAAQTAGRRCHQAETPPCHKCWQR